MDPEKILPAVWNWLPAFRAVAETEHLPTASARLHVTAAALSRSIRLLEDAVGHELFNRSGRKLVLNTRGARLLAAVEDAARAIDAALYSIVEDPLSGVVRISSIGLLTNDYVLPALLQMREAHPNLVPHLEHHGTADANDLLSRGLLDVAFYYEAHAHPRLAIEKLGAASASVYCGQGHPLFDVPSPTLDEVLAHPFSVPRIGEKHVPLDGWPVDLPRKVGMHITLLATNLAVCLSGRMVTVLPDVVAHPHLAAGRLKRVATGMVPPIDLFAARRSEDKAGSAAASVIAAVAARIAEVDRTLSQVRDVPPRIHLRSPPKGRSRRGRAGP